MICDRALKVWRYVDTVWFQKKHLFSSQRLTRNDAQGRIWTHSVPQRDLAPVAEEMLFLLGMLRRPVVISAKALGDKVP